MLTDSLIELFYIDTLAGVMMSLVAFIGIIVTVFAVKYMQGDRRYYVFLAQLGLLILSVMGMVASDQIILFLLCWGMSNALLVRLMIHKARWKPAKNAGLLAAKTFTIGFIFLSTGLGLLYILTGQSSIQSMLHFFHSGSVLSTLALLCILLAAMSQSAIWPFHRWLISSLNSPTPVSAIMHAGLVNGGGFLLARFAPLYFLNSTILIVIFVIGIGTAVVGTLWKLIQHDIKRMLACSTMAQMGFMFAECGLGLFPAAIAHLCWHGMFKANLFLASPSAMSEKRVLNESSPNVTCVTLALLCGCLGAVVFSLVNHRFGLAMDTTAILLGVVFISATQFSLTLLTPAPWKQLFMTVCLITFVCALYGLSIRFVESLFYTTHLMQPQPLNAIYLIGLIALAFIWLVMIFKDKLLGHYHSTNLLPNVYMKALNASQPDPETITANRHQYSYE